MKKCFGYTAKYSWKSLFVILLFLPTMVLAAQGQVSIKGQKLTVKQIIELIEKDTDYTFFYKSEDLTGMSPKDVNCKGSITDVLNNVFAGSNITYLIDGDNIVLKAQKTQAIQQDKKKRTVTGSVIDANTKETLIGVNIKIKDTNRGTVTDADGNYSIEITSGKEVLVVSYVGYKTVERAAEDLGVINIELPSDSEMLNEVVVVGFGTQKKVSVVGAITNIKAESLRTPTSSLNSTFGGRLAGVISTTTSGEPGKNDATNFYIRGIGTFGGRATPLIMLDGVEISSADLNYIPAESIESFSILKDASATAIYGARGANGVMLVTTKVGKENEKTRINVSFENSFNVPMSFPDFVDGVTYMEMFNEATYTRTGNFNGLPYTQEKIDNTRAGLNQYVYPNVNWKDLMFKDMSMSQRANVNVQGGSSKANYYISLQVNHDSGVLNSKKLYSFDNNVNVWGYTFQSNVDYKVTPTTRLGLRMNAQLRDSRGPNTATSTLFGQMLDANPVTFPAFYPRGIHVAGEDHTLFGNTYRSGELLYTNPYANMLTTYAESFQSTILTTVDIEQKLDFITKGLKLKGLVSFRNWSESKFNRTIQPYFYQAIGYDRYDPAAPDYSLERVGTSGTDYIVQSTPEKFADRTFQFQGSIEWSRNFNAIHDISAMLLYLQREYRVNALPTRNQGISGRLTYAYDQRYLLEANFGYNGTERLASGNRFEVFPSFAAGWVVSNEKFFEPLTDVVSNLKIRGSWGLVGNDETGTYDIRSGAAGPHFIYLDDVVLNNIGYTTGVDMNVTHSGPKINLYGVRDATWERAEKINLGIDIELFRKLSVTFDIFRDKRSNILLRRERFPEYMGYASGKPWGSIGKVKNEGLEVAFNYTNDFSKDWSLDLRGTFTYNKATMTYSDEPIREYEYRRKDGKALNGTWGYVAERLFVDQADIDSSPVQRFGNSPMPGDIKYKDMNNDGKIDGEDTCELSPYGNTPGIIYGFGATLRYKKFDLGVFFQGAAQRTIMVGNIHPFGANKKNVLQFIADDYWTEKNPNPHAAYPRLDYRDGANNNRQTSSYWMHDGAYLRFKNAEIGYNFKFGRLYLSGNNLLTFSPFKQWDPELAWNAYPLSRTFNVGIQLNF